MEFIVGRPSGSEVVQGYLAGEEPACRYFGRHFSSLDDFRSKADEVDRRFDRSARERAVQALIVPPGADPARLEAFVAEGGYMVTTGQQPGLFGGPLYSIHKALTAVRLAETLEAELGKPVIPVFWVASDDHDWAEANHTYVIGVDNELHRFEIPAPDASVTPSIHRIPMGEGIVEIVEQFLQNVPKTDFSKEHIELIREAFAPSATLADGFHTVMQQLLGRFGIFFTDAAHPAVKEHSAGALLEELARAEEMEAILSATAQSLLSDGFSLQVPILEGGVGLFLEGPTGRERLYREEDGFRLRTSGTLVSEVDVQAQRTAEPTELSPNVLLRPVVESLLFPTLAYVGGPGEMAYFAQLKDYFEAHGAEMPVVYPRFAVTAVETKIRKVLDKFGLEVRALDRPFHEVAAEFAREEMPVGVRTALGALRGAIGKSVGELGQAVKPIDPTLKGPVQHVRSQALSAIDDLEKKIMHALKRENEIALGQIEKAQLHLFPNGKPSERVQNPFYFVTRYGGSVLDGLYDAFRVSFSEASSE